MFMQEEMQVGMRFERIAFPYNAHSYSAKQASTPRVHDPVRSTEADMRNGFGFILL
jgi:hypothetical protein